MDLLNGGGGMDAISQHMINHECTRARDAIMKRGRKAYVVMIAADGPHGTVSRAHANLGPELAMAFAQVLRDEAAALEAKARGRQGALLVGP